MSTVQKIIYDAIHNFVATGLTHLTWDDLVTDKRINLLVQEFEFVLGQNQESPIEEACDVFRHIEAQIEANPDRTQDDESTLRLCQIARGKLTNHKTRDHWTHFFPNMPFPTTLHIFLHKETSNRILAKAQEAGKSLGAFVEGLFDGSKELLAVAPKLLKELQGFADRHNTDVETIIRVTLNYIKKHQKYE
jgi:hypothetical protein